MMGWIAGFVTSFIFWHGIPYLIDHKNKKYPNACIKCGATICQCHLEKKTNDDEFDDYFGGI